MFFLSNLALFEPQIPILIGKLLRSQFAGLFSTSFQFSFWNTHFPIAFSFPSSSLPVYTHGYHKPSVLWYHCIRGSFTSEGMMVKAGDARLMDTSL
jgi:hypothetical protein